MVAKKLPAQKTTLHSFFASPDNKRAVGRRTTLPPPSAGKAAAGAGGSKDQPVELTSSDDDDDDDCKAGPSNPPPRKRSRTAQAQPLPLPTTKLEEGSVKAGKGKGPLAAAALPAVAFASNDVGCIGPVEIDSSPVLAFDDDGEGGAGFYAVSLPELPACREPSPDWPDDDDEEPFDVDGLPDLVPGGVDDELGGLMNDDEQGSQLDPGEDDDELDELGLGDGDEMARHTGGLGDDGEDDEGASEVECLEEQDGPKARSERRAAYRLSRSARVRG
jgi:hypothetical protein